MKSPVLWLLLFGCTVMQLIVAEPHDWQLRLKNCYKDFPVIAGIERAEYRQLSPVIGAMSWSTNRMDRWLKRNPLLKVSTKIVGEDELEIMNPKEQLQPVDALLTTLFRVINGRANGNVEPKRLSDNVPFVIYQKGQYGNFLKAVIDVNTAELDKIFSVIQKPKKILKRHEYDTFVTLVQKALKATIGDDTVYSPEAAQMLLSTFFIANLLIDAETEEQFDAAIKSYMQAFGAPYSEGVYRPEELLSEPVNGVRQVARPFAESSFSIDDYKNPEKFQKITNESQEIFYLALVDAMVRTGMKPLVPSMLHYININLHKVFEPIPITLAVDSAQKYANCVEVALLNFFNILFFNPDTQKIDLSLIPEHAQLLRNFYANFTLENKAGYKKMIEEWTKFFVVPSAHAPSAVLSYARKVASGQPFELDGDFGNFLHAIEYLLGMQLSEVFVGKVDKDTSKDLAPILQRDLHRFNSVMGGLVELVNTVTVKQGYQLIYKGDDEVDLETGLVSFTLTRKNITSDEEAIIEFDLHYNHSEANMLRSGVWLNFYGKGNGAFTDGWINKFCVHPIITYGEEQDPQDIREIQRYIENQRMYSFSFGGREETIFKNIFLNPYISAAFKPLIIDYILDILIAEFDEDLRIKILNQALFFTDPSSEFYPDILAERKEFEPDEQIGLNLNFLTVYAAYIASLASDPYLDLFKEPLEQARQILATTAVSQHLTDELAQTYQALLGDRSDAAIKDLLVTLSRNYLADRYGQELENLFYKHYTEPGYKYEFRILYQALIIVLYEQLIAQMNQRPGRVVDILFTKPYFREFISKQYYAAMSSFDKEIKTAFNLYLLRRYNIDISSYVDLSAALKENNEKGVVQSQKVIMDIFTFPHTSRSYSGLYNAMAQYSTQYPNFMQSPLSTLLNPFYERFKRQVFERRSDSSSEESSEEEAVSSSSSVVDIIFISIFKGIEHYNIVCTAYEFIQLSTGLMDLFIKTGNLSGIQWLLPKILVLDTLNLSSQHLKTILAPLEQVSCNMRIDILAQTAIGLLNEVGTIEPLAQVIALWENQLRACKEQGVDITLRLNETLVPAGVESKQIEEILGTYGV